MCAPPQPCRWLQTPPAAGQPTPPAWSWSLPFCEPTPLAQEEGAEERTRQQALRVSAGVVRVAAFTVAYVGIQAIDRPTSVRGSKQQHTLEVWEVRPSEVRTLTRCIVFAVLCRAPRVLLRVYVRRACGPAGEYRTSSAAEPKRQGEEQVEEGRACKPYQLALTQYDGPRTLPAHACAPAFVASVSIRTHNLPARQGNLVRLGTLRVLKPDGS